MKGRKSKFMLLVLEIAFYNDVSPVGNTNFDISIGIETIVNRFPASTSLNLAGLWKKRVKGKYQKGQEGL
jgi:hypothetical protein